MCGIYGQFNFTSSLDPGDEVYLTSAVDRMRRRGPDDEGSWTNHRNCILGFRRLSILDLTPSGHQPMVTPDQRYAIIFNGEIYNYRDIRKKLQSEGFTFRSTGDSEVLLRALIHYGPPILKQLNGMFGLALYDHVENSLLLARDHAGIKPLYYMLTRDGIVFGSQYDLLVNHPWRSKLSLSQHAVGLYLRLGYIPAPYALYQNTYMLEPGSWIKIDSKRSVQKGKHFEISQFREPDLFGTEAIDLIDSALTDSVRRHLVSDVPVGTFLSGGIDSPLIASKMKEVSSEPVHAFTIAVRGEGDESPDAEAYAKEIGIHHEIEEVTEDDGMMLLDAVIDSCGEPLSDVSLFPTMLVSRMAAKRVKVVLSGDGGDELFWGYAPRFSSVLKNTVDFRQPHWLRSTRWGAKKVFNVGNGYPNLRYRDIGDWYRAKHCKIPDPLVPILFPVPPEWPDDFKLFDYNGWEPGRTAQWLRWNEFIGHLTMVLLKVDRASMYHSLEVRVPFLDREVVEAAMRVDWKSCLDVENGKGKILLRQVLQRHVHHHTNDKKGFDVPMDAWLRGPLKRIFEDALIDRNEVMGFPLNPAGVKEIFDEHLSGSYGHESSLWNLLNLALWEERHIRAPRYV